MSIALDQLIPISAVPAMLPARPGKAPVTRSTVHSWTRIGVRGVRLRSYRVGNLHVTSKADLDQFIEAAGNAPVQRRRRKTVEVSA